MPVLDADDLVIGRENVFPPKPKFVMIVPGVVVRIVGGVEWEARSAEVSIEGKLKLNITANFSRGKREFAEFGQAVALLRVMMNARNASLVSFSVADEKRRTT